MFVIFVKPGLMLMVGRVREFARFKSGFTYKCTEIVLNKAEYIAPELQKPCELVSKHHLKELIDLGIFIQ